MRLAKTWSYVPALVPRETGQAILLLLFSISGREVLPPTKTNEMVELLQYGKRDMMTSVHCIESEVTDVAELSTVILVHLLYLYELI